MVSMVRITYMNPTLVEALLGLGLKKASVKRLQPTGTEQGSFENETSAQKQKQIRVTR
jgi:hypothetical protein